MAAETTESKAVNMSQRVKWLKEYIASFDKGENVNNLFALNFALMATNSLLMPVRESLTLEGGKQLQTRLMMLTVIVSMGGQAMFAYYSGKHGGLQTLRVCFYISSLCCIATYCCLLFAPSVRMLFSSTFYLWFTFYNMTSMSTFWAIAGDVLEEADAAKEEKVSEKKNENEKNENKEKKPHENKITIFSHLAAGGTLGHMTGSSLSTILIKDIGSKLCLLVLSAGFFFSISLCSRIERYRQKHLSPKKKVEEQKIKEGIAQEDILKTLDKSGVAGKFLTELKDQVQNVSMIWGNPILFYSFMYSIFLSTALGLTVIERTIAAKASGLGADEYAKVLAGNQTLHGAIQFVMQFFGAGAMIAFLGSIAALSAAGVARFLSFIAFFVIQAQFFPSATVWYTSHAVIPVTFVIITDLICRLTTQTISKPVRESLWVLIPKSNKYRSKIIVDVLAHRIGTSLAAFLANVPILWLLNKYLVESYLFKTVYTLREVTKLTLISAAKGENEVNLENVKQFSGFLGQDHIVWGVFVTMLLCLFGVQLGKAYNYQKQKSD